MLSCADNRGLVLGNLCAKGGRLYRGSRIDKIWTDDDEAVFLARAPANLHLPLMLAIACAGIVGLTFHDLRGTAVTRLAIAGCTGIEIATLTGHSLREVHAILDAHDLNRDPVLAESAVRSSNQEQSPQLSSQLVLGCSGHVRSKGL
jgi:integrase